MKADLSGIISFNPRITKQIYGKNLNIREQIEYNIKNKLIDPNHIAKLKSFLKYNFDDSNEFEDNDDFEDSNYAYTKMDKYFDSDVIEEYVGLVKRFFKGLALEDKDGDVIVFYDLSGITLISYAELPPPPDPKYSWKREPAEIKDLKFQKFEKTIKYQNSDHLHDFDYKIYKLANIEVKMGNKFYEELEKNKTIQKYLKENVLLYFKLVYGINYDLKKYEGGKGMNDMFPDFYEEFLLRIFMNKKTPKEIKDVIIESINTIIERLQKNNYPNPENALGRSFSKIYKFNKAM